MNTVLQDLRYASRMLGKNPGFAAVIILTLALGIGMNTAVFSIIQGVLLQPLPYSDADRLVALWARYPGRAVFEETLAPGMYHEIKGQERIFDQVAAIKTHSFTLVGHGTSERVRGVRASLSCLSMLGARPALGRIFAADETESGETRGIVISHALWQRRFGGDFSVIGRMIRLDDRDYTIIGVLEEGFPATRAYLPMLRDHNTRIDYWIPLVFSDADRQEHGRQNFDILARLACGVGLADAQAEMDLLAGRMQQELPQYYPPGDGFALDVVPLMEPMVRGVRPALRLLAAAAALVHLIVCANVANLLLARATGRRREIATRMALGAGSARIVRQLLTESVLLALLGGGAGLLLAVWGTSVFHAIGRQTIPRIDGVTIDSTTAAFTFVLSIFTGLLFGLAPAWGVARTDLSQSIRNGARSLAGLGLFGRRCTARNFLAITELSLSVVLLIGAGLLIRSFHRLQCVDPGFSPENVLTFQMPRNPEFNADITAYQRFYAELHKRLASLPGVVSVGGMSVLPLAPGESYGPVEVEGFMPEGDEQEFKANSCSVLWDCFKTMKIPLVAGRYFDDRDTSDGLPVAIIDKTFAKKFWPNEDPIGKRIRDAGIGRTFSWLTVVGVVGSVRRSDLEGDSAITYYQPYSQWGSQSMYLAVRTSSDPEEMASAISGAIWTLDKNWPILDLSTMEQRVTAVLARRHFALVVLGIFAVTALLLAVVGLYAVLAHIVNQGTHEIGIRMALGAREWDVLFAVLRQGLTLSGIGLGVGLIISASVARLMESLLYEVGTRDPVTYLGVPMLLGAVALLACLIPARRAARVDPMAALRYE